MSFLFGAGTDTPDAAALQRKRDIINQMQQQSVSGVPRNFGEGLSAIGQALFSRIGDKRLEVKEDRERDRVSSEFSSISSQLMSGNPIGPAQAPPAASPMQAPAPVTSGPIPDTPQAVGNDAMDALGLPQNNPVDPVVSGINQTAQALGIDPMDLATAISYETAGTFDPTKSGPTTQWGQHRGLIQFGEPQAQEHGVNWDDPVGSQLGPNGAVANYLRSTGVQPGMGLDQIYSAINAGGVNRFDRTDENNGGAPGTVADKVAGMGDHRANAMQFMGGTMPASSSGQAPQSGGGQRSGGINPQIISQLSELMANPYLPEGQKMIAQALIQQQMAGIDPMRAMELERAQLELDALRNPTPDMPNSVQEYQFYAQQEQNQGRQPLPYGEWSIMDEAATVPGAPEIGTIPQGFEAFIDENGDRQMRPVPGGPEDKSAEQAGAIAQAGDSIALIDSILGDDALASITGMVQGRLPPATQAGTDLNVKIDQLKGQAFLAAFESLKGGGQITEREGIAAQNAMARLNRVQSTEAYRAALTELQTILRRAQARARGENLADDYVSPDDSDGWTEINGVRVREVN